MTASEPGVPPRVRPLRSLEDGILVASLAAMVLLPLVESALRATAGIGISGSASIVQHLTLILGLLGAAVAARENRLLSLSTNTFLKGKARAAAEVFAGGFAAAIGVFLAIASFQFAMFEKEGGGVLVYSIPTWVVQLVMPAGFSLIALRLVRHAAPSWRGRAAAAAIAAAVVAIGVAAPGDASSLLWPGLVGLALAVLLGAPIFAALGGLAVILFFTAGSPIASVSLDHYSLVTNPSLPTIPLFTLAGYFLAESGASRRLIRVFQTLVGGIRGGPAIVTALVCAFFTTFTGASGVTILALGGLLMPVLLSAGYRERDALGLLTGAGSLGLLLPPCLPLILYAIVAQIPMEQLFLAGVLPGVLMIGLTAGWGAARGPRVGKEARIRPRDAARALWEAKWELLLPVVALFALFGGIATPVEAAAVTALYAFVVETFVHRDYRTAASVRKVMVECGLLVGGVLLILGVALGFTNWLIDAQVPPRLVEWSTASIESPLVFLLALNVFLLIVGCLMDIFSAIVVVAPLLVPIGAAFGVDPLQLGIVFLANLQLGYLTPPVGMNLFLASYRFDKPLPEVWRAALPMLFVLLIGVLMTTYLPFMTLWLPSLGRG